jgi:transposase
MSHLTVVAHDTESELRVKLAHAHDEAFKTRLKAVLLALSGKKRFEIVERLTVDASSVTLWLHRYNEKGTVALATNKGGRPEGNPKWDQSLFDELARAIDKGGYWSIPRMQEWLKKNKKKEIPEQTVWYRMDQLKFSYKSARPTPIGGSKEKREDFKKGASSRSWSR